MARNHLSLKGESKKDNNKVPRKIEDKFQNLFRIMPLSNNVYLKQTISVNFQPKAQPPSEDQENGVTKSSIEEPEQKYSIIPTFNHDGRYYTSSFTVPYEGDESDKQMRSIHASKVRDTQKEIDVNQIMQPKPKSKNQYCAVCRQHYEDYRSHIQSEMHKKYIKRSKFNYDFEYLSFLIRERFSGEKDGVTTRSAKRKLDNCWTDCHAPERRGCKRRKGEYSGRSESTKSVNRSSQGEEREEISVQTSFNKRWMLQTAAKSGNPSD